MKTYYVTKKDIELGIHNSEGCPVWRAIARRHPRLRFRSRWHFLEITNKKAVRMVKWPPKVNKWIRDYDLRRIPTRPFRFKMDSRKRA